MVAQAQQLVLDQIAVISIICPILRLQHFIELIENKDTAAAPVRAYRTKD